MTEYPITKAHIRALKHADFISLTWDIDKGYAIHASIEKEHSSTGYDERVTIPCTGGMDNYSGWGNQTHTEPVTAYHLIHNPAMLLDIQTWLNTLRENDTLYILWKYCNDTEYLRKAGLHTDDVSVIVIRQGKLIAEYNIGSSTGPDNSARMIRSSRF